MVRGSCEPRDIRRLLATLQEGFAAGRARATEARCSANVDNAGDFRTLLPRITDAEMHYVGGRTSEAARLMAEARFLRAGGGRVSLTLLAPGFRRHRVRFTEEGIWFQDGGRAGRSDRDHPVSLRFAYDARLKVEFDRVRPVRSAPGYVDRQNRADRNPVSFHADNYLL